MKTCEYKVKHGDKEVKVHLRLTCGGQRKLKEQFEEDTLSTLMGAMNEIDKTVAVFDEALNYKGNDNVITDGEELYDAFVESGTVGQEEFAKIITDIAVASGIIRKDRANSIVHMVEKTYDSMFTGIEEALDSDSDSVKEETPTK